MSACRDATLILPGLWVGGLHSIENLKSAHFTHVVSLITYEEIAEKNVIIPTCISWTIIPIEDDDKTSIYPYFETAINTIGNVLNSGGKILVHSMNGISRSPSFIVPYIMWRLQLSYIAAVDYIYARRPCINPSHSFMRDLHAFDKYISKNDTIPSVPNKTL